MSREEELRKEINERSSELQRLEIEKRIEKNQAIIGKYFKFRNCFSCPEPDEYWMEYYYVFGIGEERGELLAFNFSKDKDGEIKILSDAHFSDYIFSSGAIEIERSEFMEEWNGIIIEINNYF